LPSVLVHILPGWGGVTPVDRIVYTVTGLVFLMLLMAVVSGMLAMVPALTELTGR
jgi:hypothetical protein